MQAARTLGACLLVVLAGCSVYQAARGAPPAPPLRLDAPARVAVLPFRLGGTLDAAGLFVPGRAVASAPDDLGASAATGLAQRLAAAGVAVTDPDAVAGVATLADTGVYDGQWVARVARKVGATLAVLGAVARYDQREGTAWAIRSPASVEYQLALMRASDGAVLTADHFEYTQQALSENLLALPRFLQARGRWLTREEILDGALDDSANKLATALRGGVPSPSAGGAAGDR
jgi:hypothetical protein